MTKPNKPTEYANDNSNKSADGEYNGAKEETHNQSEEDNTRVK